MARLSGAKRHRGRPLNSVVRQHSMSGIAKFTAAVASVASTVALASQRPPECLTDPPVESSVAPRITIADATEIAEKAAAREGYDVSKFKRPAICFTSSEQKWHFFYDGAPNNGPARVGHHFVVTIKEPNRMVRVIHGL